MTTQHTPGAIGYVDPLGYLYCVACAIRSDHVRSYSDRLLRRLVPVYADSAPHNGEPCDMCARALLARLDQAR